MVNMELLERTVSFVERNKKNHFQGWWMSGEVPAGCPVTTIENRIESIETKPCGSAGCIAGWASLFAGWVQSRITSEMVVNPADGEYCHMAIAAQHELGLSHNQAHNMFAGANTIEDIREMVKALADDPNDDLRTYTRLYKLVHS